MIGVVSDRGHSIFDTRDTNTPAVETPQADTLALTRFRWCPTQPPVMFATCGYQPMVRTHKYSNTEGVTSSTWETGGVCAYVCFILYSRINHCVCVCVWVCVWVWVCTCVSLSDSLPLMLDVRADDLTWIPATVGGPSLADNRPLVLACMGTKISLRLAE